MYLFKYCSNKCENQRISAFWVFTFDYLDNLDIEFIHPFDYCFKCLLGCFLNQTSLLFCFLSFIHPNIVQIHVKIPDFPNFQILHLMTLSLTLTFTFDIFVHMSIAFVNCCVFLNPQISWFYDLSSKIVFQNMWKSYLSAFWICTLDDLDLDLLM